jgi:hypothetical protein
MATQRERYWQSARNRLGLFRAWAKKPWVNGSSRARLEGLLLYDLAALSDLDLTGNMEPPGDRTGAFIYWLTRRFGEADKDCLPDVVDALANGDDGARGAADALTVFPPHDDSGIHGREAWDNADARQAFLTAAMGRPSAVSDALLNTALGLDAGSRAAAMGVAARNPHRQSAYFRPWFQAAPSEVDSATRCQALFAGLMRDDPEAEEALARTLTAAADDDEVHRALVLIALRGTPSQGDTLVGYAQRHPRAGAELIGIHGRPELVEPLHALMDRPESAEAAATAWWRLTGREVPRQRRLASTDGANESGRGSLPDSEWAQGWWQSHRRELEGAERLLLGRPLGPGPLATACREWAGQGSDALVWQAQLAAGPGTPLHADQWLRQRLQRLEAAGLRDAVVVPPEVETADPWEYGHYA